MTSSLNINILESDNNNSFESVSNSIPRTRSVDLFSKARRIIADKYDHGTAISKIYEETLRSMINIFGTLYFRDGDNNLINVPCYVGNPERTITKLLQENNLKLPTISVRQISSDDSDERRRYGAQVVVETLWNDKEQRGQRVLSVVPRPVNINYEITIWTKYNEDMDLVLSQVRQLFNPSLDIKTSCNDLTKGFISDEENISQFDAGDREDRVIRKIIRVMVEGYIPSPKFLITNTGKIEEINTEVEIFKAVDPDTTTAIEQGVPEQLIPNADAGPSINVNKNVLARFNGLGSRSGGVDPDTYFWDFGDGQTAFGGEVSNTYDTPGTYTVELTVSSTDHPTLKSKDTTFAYIGSDNIPPTANASGDATGIEGVAIEFNATDSSDEDEGPEELTYLWEFDILNPDEGSSTDAITTHIYNTAGSYTALLVVFDGEAYGFAERQITVNPANNPPTAVISADSTDVQFETVQFNSLSTDPEDGSPPGHFWDFDSVANPGVNTDIGTTTTFEFPEARTYIVNLLVTDSGGLTDNVNHVIDITPANNPPTADPSGPYIGIVGEEIQFNATDSSDLDNDPLTYRWDFDKNNKNEGSSDSEITTHIYNTARKDPNPYIAKLTVYDGIVSATAEVNVEVNTVPNANAGNPQTETVNLPVFFDAVNSSDDDGDDLQFQWEVEPGVILGGSTVSHIYTVTGEYTVTLSADDGYHVGTDTVLITITDEIPPTVILDATSYTADDGVNIDFTVTATADNNVDLNYTWTFDGEVAKTGTASHPYGDINVTSSFDTPGSFIAKIEVEDTITNLINEDTADVIITESNLPPDAIIRNSDPTSSKINQDINFFSDSTDPNDDPLTYLWDFKDGTTSELKDPVKAYSLPGNYNIVLRVEDPDGEFDTDSILVQITDSGPDININLETTIGIKGVPFSFNATTTDDDDDITASGWNFNDGTLDSTSLIVDHTYATDNTYTPVASAIDSVGNLTEAPIEILIVSGYPDVNPFNIDPNLNGTTTRLRARYPATFTAFVTDPAPTIDIASGIFVFDTDVSAEGSLTADPDGRYTWTLDYAYPDADPGPSKDYTVCAIFIDDYGLSGGTSTSISVDNNNVPNAAIGNITSNNNYYNEDFTFENNSSDIDESTSYDELSYSWDFGDGIGASEDETPIYNFGAPGDYTISLVVTDLVGDSDNTTKLLSIPNNDPIADAGSNLNPPVDNNYSGIAGVSITYFGDASVDPENDGALTFAWDFGDGSPIVGGQNPTHTYNPDVPGTIQGLLTVTDSLGGTGQVLFFTDITFEDIPPVIEVFNVFPTTVEYGKLISLYVRGFDGDNADNTTITYEFDLGNGDTVAGNLNANGETIPLPKYGYQPEDLGVNDVSVVLTDSDGYTAESDIIQVTVVAPEDNFNIDTKIQRPEYSSESSTNRYPVNTGDQIRIPQTYTIGTGSVPEFSKIYLFFSVDAIDGTVYPDNSESAYIELIRTNGSKTTLNTNNLNETEITNKFGLFGNPIANYDVTSDVSSYDINQIRTGTSTGTSSLILIINELPSFNLIPSYSISVEPDTPFIITANVTNQPYPEDTLSYVWDLNGDRQAEVSNILDFPNGLSLGTSTVDCSVVDGINDYSTKQIEITIKEQDVTIQGEIDRSIIYDNINGVLVQRGPSDPVPEFGSYLIQKAAYDLVLNNTIPDPGPLNPSAVINSSPNAGDNPIIAQVKWTDLNEHPDNTTNGDSKIYYSFDDIISPDAIATVLGRTRWSTSTRNGPPFQPNKLWCDGSNDNIRDYKRFKRMPGETVPGFNDGTVGDWNTTREIYGLAPGIYGPFRATRDGDIDHSKIDIAECDNNTITTDINYGYIFFGSVGLQYFLNGNEDNPSTHKFGLGGGVSFEGATDPRISNDKVYLSGGKWTQVRYNNGNWQYKFADGNEQTYIEWWQNGISFKNIIKFALVNMSSTALWFTENTRSKRWLYSDILLENSNGKDDSVGSFPTTIQSQNFPPFDNTYDPGTDTFTIPPAQDLARQDTVWLLSSVPVDQRADYIDSNASGQGIGPDRLSTYYWMEFNYRDIAYDNVYTTTPWTYQIKALDNEAVGNPKIKWGTRGYSIGRSARDDYGYKYIGGAVSGIQNEHAFYFDGIRGCDVNGAQNALSKAIHLSGVWVKDCGRTLIQEPSRAYENTGELVHYTVPGTQRQYYTDEFTFGGTTYTNPPGGGLGWPLDDPFDENQFAEDTGCLYRWISVTGVDGGGNPEYDNTDYVYSNDNPTGNGKVYVVDTLNQAQPAGGAIGDEGYPFRYGYGSLYQAYTGEGTFTYATGRVLIEDTSGINCSLRHDGTNGFPISVKGNLHGSVIVRNCTIISGGDPSLPTGADKNSDKSYGNHAPGCMDIENDGASWFGYGTNQFPFKDTNDPLGNSWCRLNGPSDDGNLDPIQIPYVQSTNDKGAQGHTDVVILEGNYFESGKYYTDAPGSEKDVVLFVEGSKPVEGGSWSNKPKFSPEFKSKDLGGLTTPFGSAGCKLLVISHCHIEARGAEIAVQIPYINPEWSKLDRGNSWGQVAYDNEIFAPYENLNSGQVKNDMITQGGVWFDVPKGTNGTFGNYIIGKITVGLGDETTVNFADSAGNGQGYVDFYNEYIRIRDTGTSTEQANWNHIHFFESSQNAPTDPHPDRTDPNWPGFVPPPNNEWRV